MAMMSGSEATISLPATLPAALRAEFRRAAHPPYETPNVVVGNGLLMTACWVFLPATVVSFVFTFHGVLAFALVLASWMYSDVPATNLLGGDAARSRAAVEDPAMVRRMWYAKNLVLWALITPLCTVVAIGLGIYEHRLATTALTVLWIATVPLGALGFSSWVGVYFPYHVLPLRYRWEQRRHWWRMLCRWTVLVLTPYGVVPFLTAVLTLPSVLLWKTEERDEHRDRITDTQFFWGLLLAAALAGVAWVVGHWYGPRLAHRHRQWLTAFLGDSERG